jgi:hypothetical protein
MSRPRFLADHDLNEHVVVGLLRREPCVELVRVREVGLEERSDAEVLEYAAGHDFLVVSHDVNTMTAAAYERVRSGLPMLGLFMVPQAAPIARVIDDLLLIWAASEAPEWRQQVIFLPLASTVFAAH